MPLQMQPRTLRAQLAPRNDALHPPATIPGTHSAKFKKEHPSCAPYVSNRHPIALQKRNELMQ